MIQVAPVEVVGLCDPDQHMLQHAAEMVSQRQENRKKPPIYGDYRKMLAEQKPEIVLIGSPDHWHALQAIEAIKSGAHVYVQKPISVDVLEGEAMVAAARKYNRVVGGYSTQKYSAPYRRKEKYCRHRVTGKSITCRNVLLLSHARQWQSARTARTRFFDYEMWTGLLPCTSMDYLTGAGGVHLWNMAMASWAICVYICLTPYGGCCN